MLLDNYALKLLNQGQTTVNNYLLQNYHQIGVSNEALLVYLLIKGNHDLIVPMPEIGDLQQQTGFSEQKLFNLFHQMIEKKLAAITQIDVEGQKVDAYDFSQMYEKLGLLKSQEQDTQQQDDKPIGVNQRQAVFESIEKEFGRTLSPIEMETISQWLDIDHYTPEIIQMALKEAVLSQVYNLKYMDRILSNWEKKNLKSSQQVEAYRRKRKASESEPPARYSGPKIPFINLSGKPEDNQ
ncbi:DnaD domain protein [Lentilactobacillus kisonensis DSM 19906 = JCM 15041]|uniref:DnaD domain protein n=2 Tax=Lentilactobacillus kisonensis TaxID=481722 RepID=H1LG77_9LACO|nr:DnaD domain protein [Lentilactobacillus kisonensis]EHO51089.1 DnaD domain protein [Lentilactobacillus kisonensis F0435]KRL23404.1 DnaD domain protein [Lentilactobacillus kisonensis DSM 19906 = JCM 15041]